MRNSVDINEKRNITDGIYTTSSIMGYLKSFDSDKFLRFVAYAFDSNNTKIK